MADEAASMALRPGKFLVGDLVSRHLESRSFDVRTVLRLVPFFSAQLDDYVRRVKSKLIAEAIIDLPVVVQGRNWNHLDFTGHRATWAAGQDYVATRKLYLDQLGIIDMSPNVDTSPHERVQRAAGSYCLPLTNRQGWHRDLFPEFEDLLFDFDPESIRDRVAGAIAHPDRFVELGIEFGERFRERYPPARFAERLLDIVDVANLQIGKNKPFIQPYFAWPSQAN
jgi:spore maturation protein CgeB